MSEPYRARGRRGCPDVYRDASRSVSARHGSGARARKVEKSAANLRRRDRHRDGLGMAFRDVEDMTAAVAAVVVHPGALTRRDQETGRMLTLRTGGLVHGGQSVVAPARPPLYTSAQQRATPRPLSVAVRELLRLRRPGRPDVDARGIEDPGRG